MAEMVGVVAAAVQLSAACLSILDFISKVKGGSSALREYQERLGQVRSLCVEISTNPLLQTPEVKSITCSLLRVVDASDIRGLIENKRLRLPFIFLFQERKIAEVCTALDRKASFLALLINHLQAQALYHLQNTIDGITTPATSSPSTSISVQGSMSPAQQSPVSPSTTATSEPPSPTFDSVQLPSTNAGHKVQREKLNVTTTFLPDEYSETFTRPQETLEAAQLPSKEDILDCLDIALGIRSKVPAHVVAVGNTTYGGGHQYLGRTVITTSNDPESLPNIVPDATTIVCAASINQGGDQHIGRTTIHNGRQAVMPSGGEDILIKNKVIPGFVRGNYRLGTQFIGNISKQAEY